MQPFGWGMRIAGTGGQAGGGGGVQPLLTVQSPGRFPSGLNASAVGANRTSIMRYPFYIGSGETSELTASAANTWATANNSSAGASRVIIEAYIESQTTGVRVPVTASGIGNPTIPWGTKKFLFDPLYPVSFGLAKFNQGDQFWFIVHEAVPLTTDKFLTSYNPIPLFAGQQSYVYDPTLVTPPVLVGGTGTFNTTGLTSYANGLPGLIILGRFVDPSSRSYLGRAASFFRGGTGTTAGNYRNPLNLYAGILEESMVDLDKTSWMSGVNVPNDSSNVWACLNMGVFGAGVSGYDPAQDYADAYYEHATDIWEQFGGNDSGNTAASIQSDLTKLWTQMKVKAPSVRIWRSKFTTRTASTDGWLTDVNQTYITGYGPGQTMETVQNWFQTQVGGLLYGILEFSRGVRSRTDYWKFPTNDLENITNWPTNDQVHLSVSVYHCLCDEARHALSVLTASVPGAISGLTVAPTDTTITLNWTQAGHVEGYFVEYKPTASGTWLSFYTYDYVTTECLTGLTASTSYDYRITPINRNGNGALVSGTVSTIATPSLVGDNLTVTLTALYSSKRYRGGYAGASMRMRRDRDGSERDIYFAPTTWNPDEAFVSSWIGSTGYARLKRRYDQMTTRRDIQASYTSGSTVGWPRIVTAGVLAKGGNAGKTKCSEYFAADNNQSYTTASTQTGVSSLPRDPTSRSVVAVIQADTVNAVHGVLGGVNGYVLQTTTAAKAQVLKQGSTTLITSTASLVANTAACVSADWTGLTEAIWVNGSASGTAAVTGVTMSTGLATVGATFATSSSLMLGYIPALAIYDTVATALPTADRQALETAFMADWV